MADLIVASSAHHEKAMAAGYNHTETVSSTSADRTRVRSQYAKVLKNKKKDKDSKADAGPAVMQNRTANLEVVKDGKSGEVTWQNNYTDKNGDWKTATGYSADGLEGCLKDVS
jgi:hypothetical protein